MDAGASLREALDVDQSGWASKAVDVELGLYSAPYKRVPIACTLHVTATTPSGVAARQDEAPATRPSRCNVTVDAPGPTRLSIDATNLSEQSVTVWVTPALPGFDPRVKIAWAVLAATAALGLGLATLGIFRWKGDRLRQARR